jgi:hypothetical protein
MTKLTQSCAAYRIICRSFRNIIDVTAQVTFPNQTPKKAGLYQAACLYSGPHKIGEQRVWGKGL